MKKLPRSYVPRAGDKLVCNLSNSSSFLRKFLPPWAGVLTIITTNVRGNPGYILVRIEEANCPFGWTKNECPIEELKWGLEYGKRYYFFMKESLYENFYVYELKSGRLKNE